MIKKSYLRAHHQTMIKKSYIRAHHQTMMITWYLLLNFNTTFQFPLHITTTYYHMITASLLLHNYIITSVLQLCICRYIIITALPLLPVSSVLLPYHFLLTIFQYPLLHNYYTITTIPLLHHYTINTTPLPRYYYIRTFQYHSIASITITTSLLHQY